MPIYEYKCNKCGEKSEVRLSLVQFKKPTIKCPKCGSDDLERVYSPFAMDSSRSESCPPSPFR